MTWKTRTKASLKLEQHSDLEKQLAYVEAKIAQIEKVLSKKPNSTAHQRLKLEFTALRNKLRKALGLKV